MFKRLGMFVLPWALTACAHVHHLYNQGLAVTGASGLISHHAIERNGHWVLGQDTSFYVALSGLADLEAAVLNTTPEDVPGQTPRDQVEDQVADLIALEISRQFPRVLRAQGTESLFDARQSAMAQRIDFVVYPRVYLWEDTAGTWTEIANALRYRATEDIGNAFGFDRARLQLTLLDATSGSILDVVSIETRAGLLSLYEESPERLLVSAVGQYVDSLVP